MVSMGVAEGCIMFPGGKSCMFGGWGWAPSMAMGTEPGAVNCIMGDIIMPAGGMGLRVAFRALTCTETIGKQRENIRRGARGLLCVPAELLLLVVRCCGHLLHELLLLLLLLLDPDELLRRHGDHARLHHEAYPQFTVTDARFVLETRNSGTFPAPDLDFADGSNALSRARVPCQSRTRLHRDSPRHESPTILKHHT